MDDPEAQQPKRQRTMLIPQFIPKPKPQQSGYNRLRGSLCRLATMHSVCQATQGVLSHVRSPFGSGGNTDLDTDVFIQFLYIQWIVSPSYAMLPRSLYIRRRPVRGAGWPRFPAPRGRTTQGRRPQQMGRPAVHRHRSTSAGQSGAVAQRVRLRLAGYLPGSGVTHGSVGDDTVAPGPVFRQPTI
jgi:hypothetical protein